MRSVFLLIILLVSTWLKADDLSIAKKLIAQKSYGEAIGLLYNIEAKEAQYYLGFCYVKLSMCDQAALHLNNFVFDSDDPVWKAEAQSLLQHCTRQNGSKLVTPAIVNAAIKNRYTQKELDELAKNFQEAMAPKDAEEIDDIKPIDTLIYFTGVVRIVTVKKALDKEPGNEVVTTLPKTDENKADVKREESNKGAQNVNIKEKKLNQDLTVSAKQHHYKILFAISSNGDKEFLSLADIGPVSSEQTNENTYFYYIGYYKSREAAEAVLPRVKAGGYRVARIMEFNEGVLQKEYIDAQEKSVVVVETENKKPAEVKVKQAPKETKEKPKEAPKTEVKSPIKEVIKSDVVSYHILFRVLNDPYQTFDDLKHIGPLFRETFDDKGNTRYLVGNTKTIEEARKLLASVKDAGYQAAFVAEYLNGALRRVVQE